MADGGGLENRYGVTPIVGSNPTPSATPTARQASAACALDEVAESPHATHIRYRVNLPAGRARTAVDTPRRNVAAG